jgi:FkbM family methyltransferase
MKTFLKYILQKSLGLQTYLYVFAQFVIVKLRWDKKEKDFFHFIDLIQDGGIILDLGANIGATSYHLSKKLPGSTVFSFEPLTLNIDTLKRIKTRFGLKNIKEFQLAVGDKSGSLEMVMPVVNNVPMHGLSHVVQDDDKQSIQGCKYIVPVIQLDEFAPIKENGQKVSAIKIDIENFEFFALKGARELISKNKPIIYCELWENENRDKCISLLNKLNYDAFILHKRKLIPHSETEIEKHNFFFIPKTD